MSEVILNAIEKSGSVGLSTTEIKYETGLTLNVVMTALRRLREKGKIYRNLSVARWRLVKYQTDDEKDYNERMRFCAG